MAHKTNNVFPKSLKSVCAVLCLLPLTVMANGKYTVKDGDNLWQIAAQNKPPETTTHQMISAIHEHNKDRLGKDINTIHPGMTLTLPSDIETKKANTDIAVKLLNTGVHTDSRSQRIITIEKHIQRIESDIDDTLDSLKASRENFSTQFNR